MRDSTSPCFIGLDIGTTTVRVVVGSLDATQGASRPSVIGHGSAPNTGMRKGVVVQADEVADAIARALTEAERISGRQIKTATVNVNGAHIAGVNSKGVIAISTANREISAEDRARVEEAATIIQLPANREIIQGFTKSYSVDGQHGIKNPIGMQGVRLEADMHLITAATPNLHSLDLALQKAQVSARHHTVSSLGAAEVVLNRQQKEAGTLVLDIGGGTTNLVVIEDGEIEHVAVLPIGGNFVTNDLAIGLRTDLDIAELVKVRHGDFLHKQTLKISHNDTDYTFAMADIKMIIEARLDELFEYVDKELHKIHRSRKLPGGVVLVGGSAKLPGIIEVARERLELAVRLGQPKDIGGLVDAVTDPSYAAATGLMLLDMLLGERGEHYEYATSDTSSGVIKSLWHRLRG